MNIQEVTNVKTEPASMEEIRFTNPRTVLQIAPVSVFEITTSKSSATENATKLALETLLIELGQGNKDFVSKLKEGFDKAIELTVSNPTTPIVGMKALVLQADRAINVFKTLEAPKSRCIARSMSRKRKFEQDDEKRDESVTKKPKNSDNCASNDANCSVQ